MRSTTLTLTISSSWRSWPGVSSPSQITVSAPVATTIVAQFPRLAGPEVGGRIRGVAALDHALEDERAGGLGEEGELGEAAIRVPDGALGPDAGQHHPLEAHLPVLDLGDVLQLGGEPGHPAQRMPLLEVEALAVELVMVDLHVAPLRPCRRLHA